MRDQLLARQKIELDNFEKKLVVKNEDRFRLRNVEYEKLFKRYQNGKRDIMLQQQHELNTKLNQYIVVARTHSACHFRQDAKTIMNRNLSQTKIGGNSKQTWKHGHNERLMQSLTTLELSFIHEQNDRHRIFTRDFSANDNVNARKTTRTPSKYASAVKEEPEKKEQESPERSVRQFKQEYESPYSAKKMTRPDLNKTVLVRQHHYQYRTLRHTVNE
jgi:hypothetical protein